MGVEAEKRGLRAVVLPAVARVRPTVEKVAGIAATVGGVAVGASYIDAQAGMDFLSGMSPLQGEDGTVGFKHVLRDLRDFAPEGLNPEEYTPRQQITAWGASLTFIASVMAGMGFRGMNVGGSWTLATLAAHKTGEIFSQNPTQDASSLCMYGGAAAVMYATGLVALVQEPKSPLEQGKKALDKAKEIAGRFKKKKQTD